MRIFSRSPEPTTSAPTLHWHDVPPRDTGQQGGLVVIATPAKLLT